MLDSEFWVNFISNVGFPIAVSAYLIWNTEKKLEKLSDTLTGINTNLALILSKLNKD